MLRSAMKRKELECEDSEEDESSIREVYVEGYNGNLEKPVLEKMMRNYFESCGEITKIEFATRGRCCTIGLRGKKAEKEALERSGSNAGGWKVVVSRVTPTKEDLERWGWDPELDKHRVMFVEGYDTSLPRDEIMAKLTEYFSKCGEVESVMILPRSFMMPPRGDENGCCSSKAMLHIYGEDVLEKVQKLCESEKAFGWNMRVIWVKPIESSVSAKGMSAGFTRKRPAKKATQ